MQNKIILLLFIVSCKLTITFSQTTNNRNCYHTHCDNSNALIPNCEPIHTISNQKVKDYSQLTGKMSFTLNGTAYTCKENTVQCYVVIRNAECCYDISINAKISDSSMIYFSYRLPKRNGPTGISTAPANFANLETFYISINNTPYANYFKTTDVKTTFTVKIKCAYQYFKNNYLLNGSFEGKLMDKQGNIATVTNGSFCSDKIPTDNLKN